MKFCIRIALNKSSHFLSPAALLNNRNASQIGSTSGDVWHYFRMSPCARASHCRNCSSVLVDSLLSMPSNICSPCVKRSTERRLPVPSSVGGTESDPRRLFCVIDAAERVYRFRNEMCVSTTTRDVYVKAQSKYRQ